MARWQRSNSCGRLYSRNHRYRHGFCDLPGLAERHPKGDRQRLVRDNGFSTWQRNGLDRAIAAVGYVFFDRRRILFRSEAPALAETALGVMSFVVVPLSAAIHGPKPTPIANLEQFLAMLLFGLIIAATWAWTERNRMHGHPSVGQIP
jgi:hypothetical protein